jgi:gamma-glutamyltranspeptidase/glutathione hydrolase
MKKISSLLQSAHLLMTLTLVLLSSMASAQINPYLYTINKMANGSKGAVSSAHPLASQVGLEILKKGGNAFDAAIATQLALAVVYPGAGIQTKGRPFRLITGKRPQEAHRATCTLTRMATLC